MTGRWRPLPASLDPELAYLVRRLRELKDRSGLSLAALAARTAYSKSSWDRYLNGATLPPKHAVETLGRLAGEPVDRLLALWEQAETQWSGRGAQEQQSRTEPVRDEPTAAPSQPVPPEPAPPEPAPSPPASPPPAPARPVSYRSWVIGGLAVCAAAVVLAVLARPLGLVGTASPPAAAPAYPVGCHGAQCAGGEAEGMACGIDAASFADLQIGDSYLELRISDLCGAAWARLYRSAVGDRVLVTDRAGHSQAVSVADPAAAEQYVPTPMLGAARHSAVRACVERPGDTRRCTPWGAPHPVPVPPVTAPPSPG